MQTFREHNTQCNIFSAESSISSLLLRACFILPIGGVHLHCNASYPDQLFTTVLLSYLI